MYPRLRLAILPITRHELPGWGRFARLYSAEGDATHNLWRLAPTVWLRGKLHGLWMKLDLSAWSERSTYFLGRFYDLETQLLIRELVMPGDVFVDIGANLGMIMLTAAPRVGPGGEIYCFEPNPVCVGRIREHVVVNRLENVKVIACGLGELDEILSLRILAGSLGSGTVAPLANNETQAVTETLEVRIRNGDAVFAEHNIRPDVIKIDVEGFEPNVIRGLRQSIERFKPAVITEFVESHLNRCGSSRKLFADQMRDLGYEGWGLTTRRHRLRHRLVCTPIDPSALDLTPNNVVWVHTNNTRKNRLPRNVVRD